MNYADRFRQLHESVTQPASPAPGLLEECAIDSSYDYRGPQSFEEKLRRGVSIIKQAIVDEALEGAEDDGSSLTYKMNDESVWSAIDRVLGAEVNVNKFKDLLPKAKAKVEEYKKK